ncbi:MULTISPECIES: hypothetical protein [unclassified Rummeliibacillus]|uniref:hypothetical protein n=1 Tax=unclassified Rummeliibacillus TaxID=2622809 RepID=UPI0013DD96B8|nr:MULTISPECIES: hypothetical protein [unclassified Rummeliibacillus]
MLKTETWWESLFTGDLSVGISFERQQELEDEEFLYLRHLDDINRNDESELF